MRISEIIPREDVLVGFDSHDKWDAIARMVEHLVSTGKLDPRASAAHLDAVLTRERSMSTGMEHGLAIPHAAVDDLGEIIACLAVVSRASGINFESIDGSGTHLIVLLLIPRSQKLLHIRTLAGIARVLGQEPVREALLAAGSGDEAWHALDEAG